jgi:hypothetical protein
MLLGEMELGRVAHLLFYHSTGHELADQAGANRATGRHVRRSGTSATTDHTDRVTGRERTGAENQTTTTRWC